MVSVCSVACHIINTTPFYQFKMFTSLHRAAVLMLFRATLVPFTSSLRSLSALDEIIVMQLTFTLSGLFTFQK